jgi:hypothetical protein
MYKCGWETCKKAYGTLNHLNAHVTMQSHGPKRMSEGKPETLLAGAETDCFLLSLCMRFHRWWWWCNCRISKCWLIRSGRRET